MASRRLLIKTKRDDIIQVTKTQLKKQGKSPATIKNYSFRVGQFLDHQGVHVESTTKKDIKEYLMPFVRSAKKNSDQRAALLQASAAVSFLFDYVLPKPGLRGFTRKILQDAKL